jgi:DNA-binding NtrC family response regulator
VQGSGGEDRVLFVDDDANLLAGVARILRKKIAAVTALGPEAGLRAISDDGPFAVVVADMHMPGMDGLLMLAKVKELAPATVRILFTGDADLEAANAAATRGDISGFLSKPCPPDRLLPALLSAIDQHHAVAAGRAGGGRE